MVNHYLSARARARRRDETGSAAVETVLMMPLLVLFLLLYVAIHRYADARLAIDAASGQAARAATLGPLAAAPERAQRAATAALAGSSTCPGPTVNVRSDTSAVGGSESVQITCHVPLADLALPGLPGHATLTGSATAPRDPYMPGA